MLIRLATVSLHYQLLAFARLVKQSVPQRTQISLTHFLPLSDCLSNTQSASQSYTLYLSSCNVFFLSLSLYLSHSTNLLPLSLSLSLSLTRIPTQSVTHVLHPTYLNAMSFFFRSLSVPFSQFSSYLSLSLTKINNPPSLSQSSYLSYNHLNIILSHLLTNTNTHSLSLSFKHTILFSHSLSLSLKHSL